MKDLADEQGGFYREIGIFLRPRRRLWLCLYGIGFPAGEVTADHAKSPAIGLEDPFSQQRPPAWMASHGRADTGVLISELAEIGLAHFTRCCERLFRSFLGNHSTK